MSESMVCCPLQGCDEYAVAGTDVIRRARKAHHCYECGETIAKGDKYEYATSLYDAHWSTYRTCLSCAEIRDHFACNGFYYGRLWDDLADNFFPDMKAGGPCMEGLSPAAKARLFERCLAWREQVRWRS